MDPQHIYAAICLVTSIVQGVAAGAFLTEKWKKKEGEMSSKPWMWTILLPLACIATAYVAFWLFYFSPAPVTIEKPVIVEKSIPCPPAETGAASTHGAQSPANSGSGNTTSYGTPPPKPDPKEQKK
jgi:hypothetical protein